MMRHAPHLGDVTTEQILSGDARCQLCGEQALDHVHAPPVGWRETVKEWFGLLR